MAELFRPKTFLYLFKSIQVAGLSTPKFFGKMSRLIRPKISFLINQNSKINLTKHF